MQPQDPISVEPAIKRPNYQTHVLNKKQVLSIPDLCRKGVKDKDIAAKFGVTKDAIMRWKRNLKKHGYDVPKKKAGRPTFKLD